MSGHLSWLEAGVVGALQGVSELFPVSSLGHSVLLPAVVGGSWARDLSVSRPESPYLAFIVGLHVATALALIVYFWRDWVRIVRGLVTSIAHRRIEDADQRLAWMLVLATVPVGLAGLLLEHLFRTVFAKPTPTALFLILNGLILFAADQFRRRVAGREAAPAEQEATEQEASGGAHRRQGSVGVLDERVTGVQADRRLARLPVLQAVLIGSAQIAALLPGISRSGITMAAGLTRGLSQQDAARFSFLLATPVILAAGVLKVPDLAGPLGAGIRGQILLGSVLSGVGAYLSVRFLSRYFHTNSMRPFAGYCVVAGIVALVLVNR